MSDDEGKIEIGVKTKEDEEKLRKILSEANMVQSLNHKLQEEKEDLEQKLTLIAEKEFDKRKDALSREGYNVDSVTTPEQLKALELQSQKFKRESWDGSGTAPLNSAQIYGTPLTSDNQQEELGEREYDSTEDMILDLNKEAKSGNKVAEKVLNQLGNKALRSKPLNIELDSPMRTIARKPVFDTRNNETPEKFEKRLSDWKKSQKWKNVGEGNE